MPKAHKIKSAHRLSVRKEEDGRVPTSGQGGLVAAAPIPDFLHVSDSSPMAMDEDLAGMADFHIPFPSEDQKPSMDSEFMKTDGSQEKVAAFNPYPKPNYSYATLIGKCILDATERRARLSTIYTWISENFPYYRLDQGGWQNSIRHNLTVNKCFIKDQRECDPPGKGSFWTIHPDHCQYFEKGVFEKPKVPVGQAAARKSDGCRRRSSSDAGSETSPLLEENVLASFMATDMPVAVQPKVTHMRPPRKPAKATTSLPVPKPAPVKKSELPKATARRNRFSGSHDEDMDYDRRSIYSHPSDFYAESEDTMSDGFHDRDNPMLRAHNTMQVMPHMNSASSSTVFFSVFSNQTLMPNLTRSYSESDLSLIASTDTKPSVNWTGLDLKSIHASDTTEAVSQLSAPLFGGSGLGLDSSMDVEVMPDTVCPQMLAEVPQQLLPTINERTYLWNPDLSLADDKVHTELVPQKQLFAAPAIPQDEAQFMTRSTLFNSLSCPELVDLFADVRTPI